MSVCLLGILSCSSPDKDIQIDADPIDQIAEDYVRLCLEIGHYDADFVDAYYGPPELHPADSILIEGELPFDELNWRAITLIEKIEILDTENFSAEEVIRTENLMQQLQAVSARLQYLSGEELPFDKESRMLYDAVAPSYPLQHFDSLLELLEVYLPGNGTLAARYSAYSQQFIVPAEKLDTLFNLAIRESRQRTLQFIDLPSEESFTLEYVTGKPWSGYNWYKGNSSSLIQLNTDLPVSIDRVLDLASHEGYPGHHVFNTLIEENLVSKRQWIEYTIYPLFSPQSLIAEGTANYGIDVAFPFKERVNFEREILWPAAGLPISEVERYYKIQKILLHLSYADNDIARGYFSGTYSEDQLIELLQHYLLYSKDRATQRLQFIKKYRSYIINYNYGRDLIDDWVERQLGEKSSAENRWKVFAKLLAFPRTASQLLD